MFQNITEYPINQSTIMLGLVAGWYICMFQLFFAIAHMHDLSTYVYLWNLLQLFGFEKN